MRRGKPKVSSERIPDLFDRWLKGESLRKIADGENISHQGLHKRFVKNYGKDFSQYRFNIKRMVLEDYVGNPKYKKEQEEIMQWLDSLTLEQILAASSYFSESNLANLSKNQCGYSRDLREYFTRKRRT